MAEGFRIDTSDLKKLKSTLELTAKRIKDLRPLARDTALIVQGDVDERLATAPSTTSGGRVYGGAEWPALTEAYLKSNPRRVSGKLLNDTGELLQSFSVGGKGNVFNSTKDAVEFGSALVKAAGLANKRPLIFEHQELTEQVTELWLAYAAGEF